VSALSRRAALTAATFFGVGYFPVASGTVATAAAVPVQIALALGPGPAGRAWVEAAAILLVALGGAAAAGAAARSLGPDDPSEVVIDEVAGYLLTMFLIPVGVATVVGGFLLFRVFDILKPWPAGPAERLHGGWGIMADDLVCGLYANLILQAGVRLL
jgi:phosphatidylglycerophosphatase A